MVAYVCSMLAHDQPRSLAAQVVAQQQAQQRARHASQRIRQQQGRAGAGSRDSRDALLGP